MRAEVPVAERGRIDIPEDAAQSPQTLPRPLRARRGSEGLPPAPPDNGENENWEDHLKKFTGLWQVVASGETARSITTTFPDLRSISLFASTAVVLDKGASSSRRLTALTVLFEDLHNRPERLPEWYSEQTRELDRVLPKRLSRQFSDFLTRIFETGLFVRTPAVGFVPLIELGIDPQKGYGGIFDPKLRPSSLMNIEKGLLELDRELIDKAEAGFTGINPTVEREVRLEWLRDFQSRLQASTQV